MASFYFLQKLYPSYDKKRLRDACLTHLSTFLFILALTRHTKGVAILFKAYSPIVTAKFLGKNGSELIAQAMCQTQLLQHIMCAICIQAMHRCKTGLFIIRIP